MNVLSIKTNTVLVSKNLAKAQFRCLDCQKVFISYKHLENHALRRQHESLLNMNGSVITGQHEAFSANDRTLIQVAGRLENVLSLLETKAAECVDRRISTAWVGPSPCASPDNVSPIIDENCRNIYVFPASVPDARKPISLFTLPNNRRSDPAFDGFGAEDAELRHNSAKGRHLKGQIAEDSEDQNTDGFSKQELMGDEQDETNSTHSTGKDGNRQNPENVMRNNSQIPSGIGCNHIEAAGTLGPLIVDLIKKLEQVSIEPKQVASTCCQTSDTEKKDILAVANDKKTITRKSVSFSEHPITIEEDREDYSLTDSEPAEKSEDEESNHLADPPSSSDSASTNSPRIQARTDFIDNHVADVEKGEVVVKPPKESHNTQITFDLESGKHADLPQMLVRSVDHASDNDTISPQLTKIMLQSNVLKPEEPQCSRSSRKFVQTKQQILDLVENFMRDCKSSSATTLRSEMDESNAPELIQTGNHVPEGRINFDSDMPEPLIGHSKDIESKVSDKEMEYEITDAPKASTNIVCVKYDRQHMVPGVVAPSSIICKDVGIDIDDMSGNSYEQFMKRFSSDFHADRKIIEEQIDRISLACKTSVDSMTRHATTHPDAILTSSVAHSEQIPGPQIFPVLPQSINKLNKSDTVICHQSGVTGLKKDEYAVLLHHETSQVQNLIDTLITDVQRWRNAKKNELSKTIRFQLEERLTANLNLLGINDKSRTLSDTVMTTASLLLDNKRSKAVKGPKASYFDTLKTAFEIEIDRIAKSRNDHLF